MKENYYECKKFANKQVFSEQYCYSFGKKKEGIAMNCLQIKNKYFQSDFFNKLQ